MGLYGAYRKWLGMVYGMFGFQNIKGPNVDFCVWLKSETKKRLQLPTIFVKGGNWLNIGLLLHPFSLRTHGSMITQTSHCDDDMLKGSYVYIYIYTYPPEPTTQFKKWAKIEKHTYCVMKRKGYLGIICYNTNIYIDSEYIYIELVHGFIL